MLRSRVLAASVGSALVVVGCATATPLPLPSPTSAPLPSPSSTAATVTDPGSTISPGTLAVRIEGVARAIEAPATCDWLGGPGERELAGVTGTTAPGAVDGAIVKVDLLLRPDVGIGLFTRDASGVEGIWENRGPARIDVESGGEGRLTFTNLDAASSGPAIPGATLGADGTAQWSCQPPD